VQLLCQREREHGGGRGLARALAPEEADFDRHDWRDRLHSGLWLWFALQLWFQRFCYG
jgi:hypothetical protein